MEEKTNFRKCLINFVITEHITDVGIQQLQKYGYNLSSSDKCLRHYKLLVSEDAKGVLKACKKFY